jgi:hypothetical protein
MRAQQQTQPQAQQYLLAFEELGLEWNWDGSEPVRAYIEREHPHLLRSYDMEFLVNAIENTRKRVCA